MWILYLVLPGLLTIANSLDHEHRQKYELNITAHDQGVVQLVSWQEVEIYVEDVNDHPPVFQELLYVFNVTEEQDPGLEVGQVVAIDRDSGQNISFLSCFFSGVYFVLLLRFRCCEKFTRCLPVNFEKSYKFLLSLLCSLE